MNCSSHVFQYFPMANEAHCIACHGWCKAVLCDLVLHKLCKMNWRSDIVSTGCQKFLHGQQILQGFVRIWKTCCWGIGMCQVLCPVQRQVAQLQMAQLQVAQLQVTQLQVAHQPPSHRRIFKCTTSVCCSTILMEILQTRSPGSTGVQGAVSTQMIPWERLQNAKVFGLSYMTLHWLLFMLSS